MENRSTMSIRMRALWALPALALLTAVACSEDANGIDNGNTNGTGNGEIDLGPPDLGPPVTLCPTAPYGPECSDQTDCAEYQASETCAECPGFNEEFFCSYDDQTHGGCERVPSSDRQGVVVNVPVTVEGTLSSRIEFFVAVAVAAETSGGDSIDCDAFYADPLGFDPNASCQNVALSVRVSKSSADRGSFFLTQFTRIPPLRDYLFVIYGFESDDFTAEPIGVYCTMPEDGPIPDPDVDGNYPLEVGPIIGGAQNMVAP